MVEQRTENPRVGGSIPSLAIPANPLKTHARHNTNGHRIIGGRLYLDVPVSLWSLQLGSRRLPLPYHVNRQLTNTHYLGATASADLLKAIVQLPTILHV